MPKLEMIRVRLKKYYKKVAIPQSTLNNLEVTITVFHHDQEIKTVDTEGTDHDEMIV